MVFIFVFRYLRTKTLYFFTILYARTMYILKTLSHILSYEVSYTYNYIHTHEYLLHSVITQRQKKSFSFYPFLIFLILIFLYPEQKML